MGTFTVPLVLAWCIIFSSRKNIERWYVVINKAFQGYPYLHRKKDIAMFELVPNSTTLSKFSSEKCDNTKIDIKYCRFSCAFYWNKCEQEQYKNKGDLAKFWVIITRLIKPIDQEKTLGQLGLRIIYK